MALTHVQFSQEFAKPVERVFAYFAEHENLGTIFGAKVSHLCDGETERGGVGSRRSLKVAPVAPAFVETITAYVPNERIEYRITKGSPMRDHLGVMKFSSTEGGGSRLDYTIEFRSPIPGVAKLVAASLNRSIPKGLAKAAELA